MYFATSFSSFLMLRQHFTDLRYHIGSNFSKIMSFWKTRRE